MGKVLLTGAAGGLGTVLTKALKDEFDLVLTNRSEPEEPVEGVPFIKADLNDFEAIEAIFNEHDIETVLHFGGLPVENEFEAILDANLRGTYHVYEAARLHGAKRVIYASSIHAVGFLDARNAPYDIHTETRPDTFYGLSKVYNEDMGKLYHDKFGLEVVNLRICGCVEEPDSKEHLMIWLSHNDLIQLVKKSITAEINDVVTIYGISANTRSFFHVDPENPLGYKPQDNAEDYIHKLPDSFGHEDDRKFVGGHQFVKEDAIDN
ncbi:NAD(P)-dependent oxidoreductase [Jeotgalibacillus sp. ET6]|uniref:NAD-dependent epimerase/dehydratase family protein n=1 Tax=Jeotgalibacillus sp. ET6 TaxID=3037260 RepID=UPI002418A60B|nr:NAD(P)-dependent oxidoreductase [Jeotgalibacillus sp. ET6]MDG5472641.1 NAD(P)-dependent oxidoreductase [Jeotgalibacillus sp. ET6]